MARAGSKRGGLRDGGNEPRKYHGEALRAVAIQLEHHAWRARLVMANTCSLAGA
jgi:hypothetical protein